ncbi:MBL fold metallo-hydrolase [Jannaschia formosa]|uniref:MBL fold metallo-hydrolase n=1 Tax=Jannaschia formosa TaxID=2259592 RepID=UPI001074E9DD|nr:MBL fold metallo-hydrolase [Jannaschia formosa]TFL16147.1 MBL fold metallo-hydrolase [Jannaschia formosa]
MTERMEEAVEAALAALDPRGRTFRVEARGYRWEPLQALRPDGPPLKPSDFMASVTHDLAGRRMNLAWRRRFIEPLTATIDYAEIVAGDGGYITGPDVALGPVPARPMTSDRVAAVRKQQWMLHPPLLVGDALTRRAAGEAGALRQLADETLDGAAHAVVEIAAVPRPMRLFLDRATWYPTRLVTQEHDHPRGDVEVAVRYAIWRDHGGLPVAADVELSLDGTVIHAEIRSLAEAMTEVAPDLFALPESHPHDPELALRGLVNAQWMHRALAMGAPISLDPGTVAVQEITPEVVTLGGGIHHSMAVHAEGGLIVLDPPQHEARSRAVIDALAERWPGVPITHLVLTHHHHDHSGGLRAYAAVGAELVVAEGDRRFVERVLSSPHMIQPDSLSAADVTPRITTVGDGALTLGGGAVSVHRITSPHCAEDLVVYLTGPKLLFNADLFNPGLVPDEAAAPPYWLIYSKDLRRQIEALDLDIGWLVGAHGSLDGRPYQSLIDFTERHGGL